MIPSKEKYHNITFKGGDFDLIGNVMDLTAYKYGGAIIVTWKCETFWERLKLFLTGKVNVYVYGQDLPPTAVLAGNLKVVKNV